MCQTWEISPELLFELDRVEYLRIRCRLIPFTAEMLPIRVYQRDYLLPLEV